MSTTKEAAPMRLGNHLRQGYPSNLILDIHSYCNASCKTCPYPHASKELPMGFMDEELFRKIVDEFSFIHKTCLTRGQVIF